MALPLFIKFLCELLNEPEMRTIFLLISTDDLSKIFNDLSKIRIIRRFTYDIFIKVNICTKEGLKLWNFRKYIIDNNCLEGILSAIKSNYFTSSYEDINEIFRELNNLLIICAAFYETQKDFKNEIFNFLYKIFEDLLVTSINDDLINEESFYIMLKNFISEIFYLAYIDKDDLKHKLHEHTLHNLISNKTLVIHSNNFKDFEVIEFLLNLYSNISEATNCSNTIINLNNYNSKEKLQNYNSGGSNKNNSTTNNVSNNQVSIFNNKNTNENINANTNINLENINNNSNSIFEKTEYLRKIILTNLLDNDINLNKYKNIINNTNYCKLILENLHTYSEEMMSYPFNSILLIISEMGIGGNSNDSQGNLPYTPEKEIKSILKNLLICEDESKIFIILKHFKLFFDFYQAKFQKLFISCGFLDILKEIFEQTIKISKINSDGGLLFSNNLMNFNHNNKIINTTINLNNYNSGENNSSNNKSNFSTPNKKNINEHSNINNLNLTPINYQNKKDFKEMKKPASSLLLIKLIEFLEIILNNNQENIKKYKDLFFLDTFFDALTQYTEYKSVAYKIWNLTINFEQDDYEIIKYTKFLSKRYQILKETLLLLTIKNSFQIKNLLEEIFTINEIIVFCFKTDNYNKILSNIQINMQFLKRIFLDFIDLIILVKNKLTIKNDPASISGVYISNNDYQNNNCNNFTNSDYFFLNKNNAINNNSKNDNLALLQNFEDFNINTNFYKAKIEKNKNDLEYFNNKDFEENSTNENQNNRNEFFDREIHNLIKNYMRLFMGMIFKFNQIIFSIEFKSQKNSIAEGSKVRKFENFISKKDCEETIKKILLFYNSLADKKYLTDIIYYLAENSLKIYILEKKNSIFEKRNSLVTDKPMRRLSFNDEQNKNYIDNSVENLCENLTLTFKEKYKLEEHELNNVYDNISNYSNFILQSPFMIKMILKNIVKELNNIKFLYDFVEFIYLLCQVNETNIKLLLKSRILKSLIIILEDEYFNNVLANKLFNNNNNSNQYFTENNEKIQNNILNFNNNFVNKNIKNPEDNFIEDKNYYLKKEKLEILEKIPSMPYIQLDLIKTTLISKIMEIIDLCAKFFDKKDIDLVMEYLYLGFSKKKPNYSLLDRLTNILKKNLKAAKKVHQGIILSPLVTRQPSFYNMLFTSNLRLTQEKISKDNVKNKSNIFSILVSLTFHRNFETSSVFTVFRLERELKDKDICALEAVMENGILKIKENEKIIPCEELNNRNIFVELQKAYNIAFIISKEKNLLEIFINEKLKAAIPCEYKYLELNQSYNLISGYSCSTTREANFDNFACIPHINFSYFMIYNEKLDPENLIFLKMSEILTGKNGAAGAHQIKRRNLKKKVFRIFAPNFQHQKDKLKYIRIGIDPRKILYEFLPDKISYFTNNQIMKLKIDQPSFCNNFIFKIQRKFFLDVTEKDFLSFIPETNITNEDKVVFNNTYLLSKLNESDIIFQSQIFEIATIKNNLKEKILNLNNHLDLEIYASRFIDNFFSTLFECKENNCFNSLLTLLKAYMLSNIGEMVEFCDNKYLAILSAILYKKNVEFKNLIDNDLEDNDDNIDELDEEIQRIFKNKSENISSEGDMDNNLAMNNNLSIFKKNNNFDEKILEKYLRKTTEDNLHNFSGMNPRNQTEIEIKQNTGNLNNFDLDKKIFSKADNDNFNSDTNKFKNIFQNINEENKNEEQNTFHRKPVHKAFSSNLKDKNYLDNYLKNNLVNNNSNNDLIPNRDSLEKFNLNINLNELDKEKNEIMEKINIKTKRNTTVDKNDIKLFLSSLDNQEKDEINPDFIRLIEISNLLDKVNENSKNNNNRDLDTEDNFNDIKSTNNNIFNPNNINNLNSSFNNTLNIEKQKNIQNQYDSSIINDRNSNINSIIFNKNDQFNISSGQINSIKDISTQKNLQINLKCSLNDHHTNSKVINYNTSFQVGACTPMASPDKQITKIIDSKTIEILFNFAFGTDDYEELKMNFFNPLFPKIITEVIFDLNFFKKLDDKVKVFLIEKMLTFFNQADYVFINSEINYEIKVNILSKMFKILMLFPHQEEVDQFAIPLITVLLEQILKFKKGELEPTEDQLRNVINSTQEFILIAGYFNDLITSHLKYRDFDQEQLDNTSYIIKIIFKKLFEEKTKIAREMILSTFTKIWEDLSISNMSGLKQQQELRKSITNSGINKLDNLLNPSFFLKLYNKEINNKGQLYFQKSMIPTGSNKNRKTIKIDEDLSKRNRSIVKKKENLNENSFISKKISKEKKEISKSKTGNNTSTNLSNSKTSKNNSLEEKDKGKKNNLNNSKINFKSIEKRGSKKIDKSESMQIQINQHLYSKNNRPISKDHSNDFATTNTNVEEYFKNQIHTGYINQDSISGTMNDNRIFIYDYPSTNQNNINNSLTKEKSVNFNMDGTTSYNNNLNTNLNPNNINKANYNAENNNILETQQLNNLINNSNIMSHNCQILPEFEDSIDYSEYNNQNINKTEADFENENENNIDIEGECKGDECRLCSLIANLQQTYFTLILKFQESKKLLKKFFYYQNIKYYDKNAKILIEKQLDFSSFIFNHEGAARIKNKLILKLDSIKNEELNKKFYGSRSGNYDDWNKKFCKNNAEYLTDKKSNFEKMFDCLKIKKFVSQICYLDQIFRLNFVKNLINPNDDFISAYNCLLVEECHHIDAILILGKSQFYILTNLHLDREGFLTYSKQKFRKTFWILNEYTEDWDRTCPYLNHSGSNTAAKLHKKNLHNKYNINDSQNDRNLYNETSFNDKKYKLKSNGKTTKKMLNFQRRKATIDESKMLKFQKLRKGFKFYSFTYDRINEIFKRRFLMKHNSLEIFLKTGKNFYLCFNIDKRENIFQLFIDRIVKTKKRQNNSNSSSSNKIISNPSSSLLNSPFCYFTRNSKIILKKVKGKLQKNHKQIVDAKAFLEDVQDYWEKGIISNFNYLMILNTLSGRSYNDISQYIILPWIIKDYSSDGLNLNNYEVYRDLTRPIHAIDDNTYRNLSIKYSEADEFDKFHSGSHYSSPGFVCYFLIRTKPFSYISAEIQGGYFDIADRLFNNIKNLWDVNDKYQELIPEMFYFPEAFVNYNDFDYGTNQNCTEVNDVLLPSWSRGDPRLFAKMNKKALESSKVSEKLSDWIDLIFGIKQQGKEAIKSLNIFRPLCYEGKIDLSKLEERDQDDKIVEIHDFGQVPIQLFSKHHNKKEKHLNSAAFFSKLHFLIHFKEKEKSINLNLENFPEHVKFYSECENYLSYGEGGMSSFLMCYDNEEKSSKFNDSSNTLFLVGHHKFLIGPKFTSYIDYSFSKYSFAIVFPLYKISFVFNTFRNAPISIVKTTSDGKRLVIAFLDGVLRVYRIYYDKKERIFHPDYEKKKDKGFFGLFGSKKDTNVNNKNYSNNISQITINNNFNFGSGNGNINNFNNFERNTFNYNYSNNYNANTNQFKMNSNSNYNAHNLFTSNYNYNTNTSCYNNMTTVNNINNTTVGGNFNQNNQNLMTHSTVTGMNNSFVELNPVLTEKDLKNYLTYENFNNKTSCGENIVYPIFKFSSNISDFKDFQIFYNNCNHEISKSNSKGAKYVSLKFIKENRFFYNEIKLIELCECFSLLVGIDIRNNIYICELNKFEILKTINLNKILPKIDQVFHISIDNSSGDFIVVSSLFVVLFNINGVILAVLDLTEHPKLSKISTALIKSVKIFYLFYYLNVVILFNSW